MSMVSVADAKAYLRIEYNDEDELIQTLITTAEEDVASFVNAEDLTAVANPNMITLAIKLLVAHWYSIREPVAVGGVTIPREIPLSVQRLLWRERKIPI